MSLEQNISLDVESIAFDPKIEVLRDVLPIFFSTSGRALAPLVPFSSVLGVSPRLVELWVQNGGIEAYPIGKTFLISVTDTLLRNSSPKIKSGRPRTRSSRL